MRGGQRGRAGGESDVADRDRHGAAAQRTHGEIGLRLTRRGGRLSGRRRARRGKRGDVRRRRWRRRGLALRHRTHGGGLQRGFDGRFLSRGLAVLRRRRGRFRRRRSLGRLRLGRRVRCNGRQRGGLLRRRGSRCDGRGRRRDAGAGRLPGLELLAAVLGVVAVGDQALLELVAVDAAEGAVGLARHAGQVGIVLVGAGFEILLVAALIVLGVILGAAGDVAVPGHRVDGLRHVAAGGEPQRQSERDQARRRSSRNLNVHASAWYHILNIPHYDVSHALMRVLCAASRCCIKAPTARRATLSANLVQENSTRRPWPTPPRPS